jgi:hypothetical protein
VTLLIAAALMLGVAIVIIWPIFTHQSAGGSGQQIPGGFVAETSAAGEDGRIRTLEVRNEIGEDAELSQLSAGQVLIVSGSGYDSRIGIYVSICMIPESPEEKPGPCLGGLPEGAIEGEAAGIETAISSAWITDDWAWRAFATQSYDDASTGSFTVRLLVPPAVQENLNCEQSSCAIATRADHTAGADRVQDMLLPVAYATPE